MNRRRERLQPSAPDFLFKEASPKSYDSAKFPVNPSAARVFCVDGVKKSLPDLYQFLVGMVANPVDYDTRDSCTLPGVGVGAFAPFMHPLHIYRVLYDAVYYTQQITISTKFRHR